MLLESRCEPGPVGSGGRWALSPLVAAPAQIPSDNCPFNEAPDMKAAEITEAGKEALLSKRFDMVRMNYANPDMVRPPAACQVPVHRCSGSAPRSVMPLAGFRLRCIRMTL